MSDDHLFAWQFPNPDRAAAWSNYSFSVDRWWGNFARDLPEPVNMFAENPWAIGPFSKYSGNPVFAPDPTGWDCGRYDGGVHNGSIIINDGRFNYIYRGERPIDVEQKTTVDYMCDIGAAASDEGIHFTRDRVHSPFFRYGEDRQFSYEDVNIVKHNGVYYLFCNQWLWERMGDPSISGVYLAVSEDLVHWQKVGIVFPYASRIHRNPVVLQSPENEAISVNGSFVMYINDGLIAYSSDMIHWESRENPNRWPGGEGCFALAAHNPDRLDDIVLFTGGHHTGHFYAIGEVLLSKSDPEKPLAWLPRPVLAADTSIPYENGRDALPPHAPISSFADCIFFNALTRYNGKWWMYYGGSEYYTCLATANARASDDTIEK